MSGLYLHIPFCAQSCHYCDFHFSTNLDLKSQMVNMICREIELQKNYLADKNLGTIYFGGGTPSLLSQYEIELIVNTIGKFYSIEKDAEISLEANPDDLTLQQLRALKGCGINRLSIGIQTFDDGKLKYLNRIHSSEEAINSVLNARKAGFENLTIDLIYGIPAENHSAWEEDLTKALELEVPHISSYCLTIEDGTVFGSWKKKKLISEIDEEFSAQQFEMLVARTQKAGMEQYEISNFSIPGRHSRHNSNYWMGVHYLGIGPSAHSFNGLSRQYNVSNNSLYIKSIDKDIIPCEVENLEKLDIFNEALMTGLRTKWGFDLQKFEMADNVPLSFNYSKLNYLASENLIKIKEGKLFLTAKGKLLADKITLDLFA